MPFESIRADNACSHAIAQSSRWRGRLQLVVSTTFVLAAQTSLLAEPTFQALPFRPSALSHDGSVVVGSVGAHLFRQQGSQDSVDLGTLPSVSQLSRITISADGGVVVGILGTSAGDGGFTWTASSGLQPLAIPEGVYCFAIPGNTVASIVGAGQINTGPGQSRAIRWSLAGGVELLAVPPETRRTGATAISGDGNVVVGTWEDEIGARRACRWTASGASLLDTSATSTVDYATAVSRDGSVVMGWQQLAATSPLCRWDASGAVQIISPINGDPKVMTADGRIVAGMAVIDQYPAPSGIPFNAFVWSQSSGVLSLNQYLPSTEIDLGTAWLMTTEAISGDGAAVAVSGWDEAGPTDNWVVRNLPNFSSPGCHADLGRDGGFVGSDHLFDNNDFIAFISLFFNMDSRADLGIQGGLWGADGHFDNNDFISFINLYFQGC